MMEVANKLKVKWVKRNWGIRGSPPGDIPAPNRFHAECQKHYGLIEVQIRFGNRAGFLLWFSLKQVECPQIVKVTIMYRILLVDDEENVLNALQRELQGKYEIEAFTSPLQALQRCREVKFDLVISDYMMPELKGLQFLKQLGEIQPDAARMILSDHADIDGLLGAINETHIYRFIAKPWDKSELKISITQALDYRRIILENSRLADAYRNIHPQEKRRELERPHRIMLVDGDEAALKLVSNALTQPAGYESMYGAMRQDFGQGKAGVPHDFKYVVDTFGSGLEALDHIRHNAYELAIVAHTLPEMDGITFLGELRKIQPDSACILISPSPDMNALTQAVNEAHVDSFLHISWLNYELKADAMRRSWNLYQLSAAVLQALMTRSLVLENRRLAEIMRE